MQIAPHPQDVRKNRGHPFAPDRFNWQITLLGSLALILALACLLPISRVHGQQDQVLLVGEPDLSAFPQVTVEIKLPPGLAQSGEPLVPSQMTVLEDGRQVTVQSLRRVKRGVGAGLLTCGMPRAHPIFQSCMG